jgi:pimeloyl-ACP methyl ester carboxylesterase
LSLIPKLDIQDFILIGHSMGGKVAQLVAGRNEVKGLKGVVLLAPAPPTPLVLPEEMREQQLSAYASPEAAEFVARNVLSSSLLQDDVVKNLVEDMLRGNEFAKRAWPEHAAGEDIVEEARRIGVPVLVIAGKLDKVETIERVRREVLPVIKGAEMVVVDKVGHLLLLEASDVIAGHVEDFLKKLVI